MGFEIETGISAATVFLQGLLSFFSPCVLPLLPLYMGYLSGGAKVTQKDGSIDYPRRKIIINTLFFVLGIGAAFFLLGLGFTALGRFFSGYRIWFARFSGILIILFGLYQIGVFGSSQALSREHRLPLALHKWSMNPLTALLLGFTFSFAWTPCVGPALSSVLLMAGSASTSAMGFMLIGTYTLGFVIPFLATGIFAGTLLNLFKKHMNVVRYTVKIGGIIMVLMGVMILTGWMNGITSYLSSVFSPPDSGSQQSAIDDAENNPANSNNAAAGDDSGSSSATEETEEDLLDAPDFTLIDQNGNEHTLSDYKGKTVFLNFWATWCGPCQMEMPDIQALYESYGKNTEELIVLGIANPKSEEYPNSNDGTTEEVVTFLTDHGCDYPVVMDKSGTVFADYGVSAFPTSFMINTKGKVFGYVSGALTKDMIDSIVEQTMTGVRK